MSIRETTFVLITIRRQLQFSRHILVQNPAGRSTTPCLTCRKMYHSPLNLQEEVGTAPFLTCRKKYHSLFNLQEEVPGTTPFLTCRKKYHSLLNLQEEVSLPS
jgi:hypothetical protein